MIGLNFGDERSGGLNFGTTVSTGNLIGDTGDLGASTGGENVRVSAQAETGAWDNYSFARQGNTSLHAPPPRVVSTASFYNLFIALTYVKELQRFVLLQKEELNTPSVQRRTARFLTKGIKRLYRWILGKRTC